MSFPVVTISSAGQRLDPSVDVLDMECRHELNRIPEASVTVADGSVTPRGFAVSDLTFFQPGKALSIAIAAHVGARPDVVFEGVIVRHAVQSDSEGSVLRVEAKDAAFKLTRERSSAAFKNQSDSDVFAALARAGGLGVERVTATAFKHEQLVKYRASAWDFIVSRADVSGMFVKVTNGQLSLLPMTAVGNPRVRLNYGQSKISELELELDGAVQWGQVQSVGWDATKLAATQPTSGDDPRLKFGNLDTHLVAGELGGNRYTLMHPAALPSEELQTWARARLARSQLAFLRGRMVIDGRVDIAPGDYIALAGVGARFNGRALVSAVIQRVDLDGWSTELRLGLSPEWFARQPDIAELPAAGLLPPVEGLQLATVASYEMDPSGEQRIRVVLPDLQGSNGPVWARMLQLGASDKHGHVYWPEAGDEVLVGFVDSDPRQAVILGSLYSKAHKPPSDIGEPTQQNNLCGLVSKRGTKVVVDDEKGSILIQTNGGRKLEFDDKSQAITIADQHGNSFVMDDKGITLKSRGDIAIDATGNVTIEGTAVDVK